MNFAEASRMRGCISAERIFSQQTKKQPIKYETRGIV